MRHLHGVRGAKSNILKVNYEIKTEQSITEQR